MLSASSSALKVSRLSFETVKTNNTTISIDLPFNLIYLILGTTIYLVGESFGVSIQFYYSYNQVKTYTIRVHVEENKLEYTISIPNQSFDNKRPTIKESVTVDLILFGY